LVEFGCVVCMRPPEIHHLIGYKYSSLSKKADDSNTIPLCVEHHRGSQGIHHLGMRPWEKVYGTQEHLLNIVNKHLTTTT
jgi:hypothetical protein